MEVKERNFGCLSSGKKVSLFTVSNKTISFSATNYGCNITSILLPSKAQGFDDIVLGYSTLSGYIVNKPHFGSVVGRYAGRIANAEFSILGEQYLLTQNQDGRHCLHGGFPFYNALLWKADTFCHPHEAGIRFTRISPDGEQGFPGEVVMQVTYALTPDNEIIIRYEATTTKVTPINFTNHTYFNLNPAGMRSNGTYVDILNHELQIFADNYLEIDSDFIPTGDFIPVENTPYDFRQTKVINKDFDKIKNGYDGTWVISTEVSEKKSLAAILREPVTKRELSVYSTQPGLTMYTGNFLDNEPGKNGVIYGKQSAVCLESQHFPDSVHQPHFPNVFLHPGDKYKHETVWVFKI